MEAPLVLEAPLLSAFPGRWVGLEAPFQWAFPGRWFGLEAPSDRAGMLSDPFPGQRVLWAECRSDSVSARQSEECTNNQECVEYFHFVPNILGRRFVSLIGTALFVPRLSGLVKVYKVNILAQLLSL